MNSSAHGGGISFGILESSSKNPLTPNTMVSNMVSTCRKLQFLQIQRFRQNHKFLKTSLLRVDRLSLLFEEAEHGLE